VGLAATDLRLAHHVVPEHADRTDFDRIESVAAGIGALPAAYRTHCRSARGAGAIWRRHPDVRRNPGRNFRPHGSAAHASEISRNYRGVDPRRGDMGTRQFRTVAVAAERTRGGR